MTVKLKSAGAGGARPRRARARVALALTLALAPAAPAWAQKPSLGFGLGLASVPRMVAPDCHGGRTGVVAGGSADVRLAVPVARRLALEGRVGGYVPFDFAECALWVVAPPPDGPATLREYPEGRAGSASSDLRLRFQAAPGLVVAAGGGWLWSAHTPYLALSPGLRTGGHIRFIAELDGLLGRFPYDLVTNEWQSGVILREVSRSSAHEWHMLTSVRAGMEVDLR